MSAQSTHNEQALRALIDYIDRERQRRRDEIIVAAENEARELIRSGLRAARERIHEAVQELRRERRSRLRASQATEQGRLRQREHEIVRARLDHAWEELEGTVARRWQEAQTRQEWLNAAILTAAHHLPDGQWILEHAGDCDPEELKQVLAILRERRPEVEVECVPVTTLSPGFRVRAGNAMLDATTDTLLARRAYIEGLLLGALASARGIPMRPQQSGVGA